MAPVSVCRKALMTKTSGPPMPQGGYIHCTQRLVAAPIRFHH